MATISCGKLLFGKIKVVLISQQLILVFKLQTFMRLYFSFLFLIFSSATFAQKIVYSEVDFDDTRRMTFEIIGKVSGNFLVYKNLRNRSFVSIYDNNMEQKARVEQDYIPDRALNVDFFPYSDFFYVVYQYQKRNVVYCDAAKINGDGKMVGKVITLDTTHIGFAGNNKVYSAISSEDKSKLMIFKINSRNKSNFAITTLLFDNNLELKKRSRFDLPMEEYREYLNDFNVDNDGDFVFTKVNRNANETINNTELFWKAAASDSLISIDAQDDKLFLDDPHIKIDNYNKRYFLSSFYYTKKRGNIEGFYFYVWDKTSRAPSMQNSVALGDELRKEAKSNDANTKTAFNDYFIRDVIIKKDGGFLINTESYYTTSRFNSWDRLNYLYGYPMLSSFDYYYPYSPYNSWYWRNRYDNQSQRHHAENITILSFDRNGSPQWNAVVHKDQFDDQSDERISYQTMNTGGQIHYLFNVDEKRALLLNDYTLSPGGQINHNPTLKNLDRGYEFMPKYGKQVSSYQFIVPCYFRNLICFAKIEFNQ